MERSTQGGMIIPWLLFAVLLFVMLQPEATPTRGLIYSPRCRRTTGLIVDFPPQFPDAFFSPTG
ncbi:MAG: hypothetical protein V3W34_10670 [Phycisphaerae bacterium]